MPTIEWSEDLSVGFIEIDKDHQQLVNLLNDFTEEIENNGPRSAIEDSLEELVEYTGWHFRHEERLMQEHGYEEMKEHQVEHKTLTDAASEIMTKYEGGDDSVLEGLIPFLQEWVANHIQETDKKLGAFLASQS